jgi:ribosomal-protein-alanine N-acetyltransferase
VIVIRRAVKDDIRSVYELEKRCFKDPYPEVVLLMLYQLYPELFFVAENGIEKNIVGYVSGMIRMDGFGHIASICVDEKYRRRGIGRRLMETIESAMRTIFKVCNFRLEVRVSNEPAIKLYESLGYRIISRLKGYYLDGEDGYLMTKTIC